MNKALLLSLVITMLATIQSYAQWAPLPYLITGTDTASALYSFRGIGLVTYACTNKGLFAGANDGDTWTNVTFTKSNTMNLPIRMVYLDSATGKLYAGGDSALFVSSDNGASWATTGIAHLPRINDVARMGANLVLAYGSTGRGGIYVSTNDFASATLASLDSIPVDKFAIVGSDLYVAGKYGVYKSTDNGATWGDHGADFPALCRFYSLTRSGNSFYAGDISGGGLFKSTDDGATWGNTDTATLYGFCQVCDLCTWSDTRMHGWRVQCQCTAEDQY